MKLRKIGKNIFHTWQDVLSETGETGNSTIITKKVKMTETSSEEVVDLKVSSNDSAVENFSKTEVDIFGNTTELFNGTISLKSNISLDFEEPFVIQNGKVKVFIA